MAYYKQLRPPKHREALTHSFTLTVPTGSSLPWSKRRHTPLPAVFVPGHLTQAVRRAQHAASSLQCSQKPVTSTPQPACQPQPKQACPARACPLLVSSWRDRGGSLVHSPEPSGSRASSVVPGHRGEGTVTQEPCWHGHGQLKGWSTAWPACQTAHCSLPQASTSSLPWYQARMAQQESVLQPSARKLHRRPAVWGCTCGKGLHQPAEPNPEGVKS